MVRKVAILCDRRERNNQINKESKKERKKEREKGRKGENNKKIKLKERRRENKPDCKEGKYHEHNKALVAPNGDFVRGLSKGTH